MPITKTIPYPKPINLPKSIGSVKLFYLALQELDSFGVILQIQYASAFRAFEPKISGFLEVDPYTGAWTKVYIAFIGFLMLKPFTKLLYFGIMQILHQILDSFLVESPVAYVPSFLPVLFPVISNQVIVIQPVKNVPNLMNICFDLFRNFEVRNVLLIP